MATSMDVSWQLDGITMEGTVVRPDGTGPFPAVVLVAGSGPTDRDWCSPLLPGANGSGRLFAEALADAGFATIRYDKRASGPHVMENLPKLIGTMSMQSHLDELAAATAALAGLDFVDTDRIAGFGNSEGTLHVLNHAASAQDFPFAAAVLAAPPGGSATQGNCRRNYVLRHQNVCIPGLGLRPGRRLEGPGRGRLRHRLGPGHPGAKAAPAGVFRARNWWRAALPAVHPGRHGR